MSEHICYVGTKGPAYSNSEYYVWSCACGASGSGGDVRSQGGYYAAHAGWDRHVAEAKAAEAAEAEK